jgi:hypothetical protein
MAERSHTSERAQCGDLSIVPGELQGLAPGFLSGIQFNSQEAQGLG